MTVQRCPGPELLLLAAHDLLDDDDDAGAVRAHLETCDACRRARAALDGALAAPPLPFAPDELLPALRAKREAHDALASAPAPAAVLGVRLLCTFCKDGLPAPETVYCASCLAPHHADCFGEHGRCAAPGCDGVLVVRTAASPPRRPRRRGWLLLASGLLVGGGAVAALTVRRAPEGVVAPSSGPGELVTTPPQAAPAPSAAPGPVATPDPASEPEWVTQYRKALASRKVTVNFPGTALSEVISFLQDVTGLNLVLAPEIDAEATQVNLRLADMPVEVVLQLILEQTGTFMSFEDESIVLRLPGIRRVLAPRYAAARPPVRAVDAQVLPALPEELRDAWFAPAASGSEEPGLVRARGYLERLTSQQVTLQFDETPLGDAFGFLRDITQLPIRVDPLAEPRLRGVRVGLRLRDVTLASAIDLLMSNVDELVLDVDRDGLLVRPHDAPPLEQRLAACGANAEEADGEARRRLEAREVSLDLDGVSLDHLCDFIRDLTGLNIVIDPRARRPEAKVTLQRRSGSVREAFDAGLLPLGLGLRVEAGVVRVVPRAEATLRSELEPRLTPLRAAALKAGGAAPLRLGELAAALEEATGARVVLTPRARACRARVRLPEGQTVEAALEVAAAHAGVRHGWSFLPGTDDPVLVLDAASGPGPLVAALAPLEGRSPWEAAPASATAALEAARDELRAALRALAGAAAGTEEGPLEAALAASQRLRDVRAGHQVLARRELAVDGVGDLVDQLHAIRIDMARLGDSARAARARLSAVEARLADTRLTDDERREAEAHRVELERERAVYERDELLDRARLESTAAQRMSRLGDLSGGLPSVERARLAARGELQAGRAWDAVFSGDFDAWWEATTKEGLERVARGLSALERLGVRVEAHAEGVVVTDVVAGRPLLDVGQRLVSVGGRPVPDLLGLVDALGAELVGDEAHELSTVKDGEVAVVKVRGVEPR